MGENAAAGNDEEDDDQAWRRMLEAGWKSAGRKTLINCTHMPSESGWGGRGRGPTNAICSGVPSHCAWAVPPLAMPGRSSGAVYGEGDLRRARGQGSVRGGSRDSVARHGRLASCHDRVGPPEPHPRLGSRLVRLALPKWRRTRRTQAEAL